MLKTESNDFQNTERSTKLPNIHTHTHSGNMNKGNFANKFSFNKVGNRNSKYELNKTSKNNFHNPIKFIR